MGALIIALLATLVVDFTEGDEGESEDIDVDEIEITLRRYQIENKIIENKLQQINNSVNGQG
ncbi:MAG: hypothetical protein ACLS54_08840 [Anaerostipes hadrus]